MAAPVANPHDFTLPQISKKSTSILAKEVASPKAIAEAWLLSFACALRSNKSAEVAGLIHEDGWLRDHLAFSFDLRTIRGAVKIAQFLDPLLSTAGLHSLKLREYGKFAPNKQEPIPGLEWIESMFTFDTAVGSGKGMIRLVCLPTGTWKAHMVYTALQELHDFKERTGELRPPGGNSSLKGGAVEGNWYERRQRQKEFMDEEPDVLIIGAGQSGLSLGARLQTGVGLSCLIIDKGAAIGDNWRQRYRTLVTHDPVPYDHLPYMDFPRNWPIFSAKDKLADWLELYSSAMELNVWLESTIKSAQFSDHTQSWTTTIQRGDSLLRVINPKHIVLCTGQAGEAKISNLPGQDKFKGVAYHSSQHKDASSLGDVRGKKITVVGTGNSGHDIAQNYYESGAHVTMLQRSGTYVISAKTGLFMIHEGMYDEHGPPTEDADVSILMGRRVTGEQEFIHLNQICGQSLPLPVQFALDVGLTDRIKEAEKDNIEGLRKAGFKLDFGHDGSGIYRKYITRGGGYYIDVGCSDLIINGKIKVEQSPDGIKGFSKNALILADGRELESDVVVLATGYDNMRTTLRKVLGDHVANRCKDVWDLDAEAEVNGMWRPSGHPRLWYHGGGLALCRIYSRFLALQIRAVEEGWM